MSTDTLPKPQAVALQEPSKRETGWLTLCSALAVMLTSLSLHSVLQGSSWFGPCLIAIVSAAMCGELGRRLRGPSALLPLITPTGLLLLVTGLGAAQTAQLGIIPGTRTPGALGDLIRSALDDIDALTAPLPTSHGLTLIAATAVFGLTALTDLLSVTLRKPALAVVPLVAIVIVLATVPSSAGLSWLTIVAAVTGWLILLAVDNRLREHEWGRSLTGQPQPASLLRIPGAPIAAISIICGLLVPVALAFPNDNSIWRNGSSATFKDGEGNRLNISAPLVTVRSRLHSSSTFTVAMVETSSPDYLRLTSLDNFDGSRFTLAQDTSTDSAEVSGFIGNDPTQGAIRTASSTISFSTNYNDSILPLPYSPVDVTIDKGRWILSENLRSVFSLNDGTREISVRVISHVPNASPERLRSLDNIPDTVKVRGVTPISARQLALDLSVPDQLPAIVARTAAEVTQGSTTRYDQAIALQQWFSDPSRGKFVYDLNANVPEGINGIAKFLEERRGYCEQFASAFVAMARTLGIPARVAVGFTAGTPSASGVRIITNRDSHAWPEVYFPGQGWLRFEPTPRSDTTSEQPTYAQTRPLATPSSTPSPTPRSATPTTTGPSASKSSGPAASSSSAHSDASYAWAWPAFWIAAVLTIVATPGASAALLRRRRRRAAAAGSNSAAWIELMALATDLGRSLPTTLTPRQSEAHLLGLLGPDRGDAAQATHRVFNALEHNSYAPGGSVTAITAQDLATIRSGALDAVNKQQRLRAALAPQSLINTVKRWRKR